MLRLQRSGPVLHRLPRGHRARGNRNALADGAVGAQALDVKERFATAHHRARQHFNLGRDRRTLLQDRPRLDQGGGQSTR